MATPKKVSVVMAHRTWGAKGRTNAIGALIGKTLLTVMLITANVDTNVFTSWVQQDLLPKLPENSVIVMDNAAFHKGKDMQNMITESGHILLYLHTYSPDLNPIEKKWAQAKKLRRSLQCNIDQLFKSYLL
jgi:transposase